MPASYKYGAEAVALVGLAYGLIKWVGRNLRSQISDRPLKENQINAFVLEATDPAGDALVRQGLVSPEQLAQMSSRERAFMLTQLGPQMSAASAGGGGPGPTPPTLSAVKGPPVSTGQRSSAPTPTRLHSITPSRPPLGMTVHCPACGVPLDREALQRLGAATCQRCKRPVSAHIQRGRVTVIVEETTDESEHRRRVEGEPPR